MTASTSPSAERTTPRCYLCGKEIPQVTDHFYMVMGAEYEPHLLCDLCGTEYVDPCGIRPARSVSFELEAT